MLTIGNKQFELIDLRVNNLLPSELSRKPTYPDRIDLSMLAQLAMSHVMAVRGSDAKLIRGSTFGGLAVASDGANLDNAIQKKDSAPASFDATHQIERAAGFKVVDVLVRTQAVEIRITWMNDSDTTDITLDAGRYSFAFNCRKVQVKYETSSGATYQLIGYYTQEGMVQA